MASKSEKITQISKKVYFDSAEEAGKILDNVMNYTLGEIGFDWGDELTTESFLTMIGVFYQFAAEELFDKNDLLSHMTLLDSAIQRSMNRLPWIKLFTDVTLNALFDVYSQRSTQGINYKKQLAKVKRMIKKCTDLDVDNTTTIGIVLQKVRYARKCSWQPDEDINKYAYETGDCYRIVKMLLYDAVVDIYDISTIYQNSILESDGSIDSYGID